MWLVFAVATTLIWGLAELFYKKGALPDEKYSHLKMCVFVGGIMGCHALFTLLTGKISYAPINLIKYLPVSFCYILSMTLSYFGIRFIEESLSDPIENTSGAICSMLCVMFLGSTISVVSVIAILIILAGILGIGFLEGRTDNARKKAIGKRLATIAFLMPFCYALLDALGSFLDVYYLDITRSPLVNASEENIEMIANTSYELTFAVCALAVAVFLRIKKVDFNWPMQKDKFLAGILETTGQITYVYAMSGNGAIAAPLISSVCAVSLLLSRIFLKEKLSRKQYFFIGMVISGILLLAVAEGE